MFDKIVESQNVAIYLPPQTLKFHVCDPSGPRLLTAAIYYNYLNWGTDNARVPLVAVTVITNILENVALLLVK